MVQTPEERTLRGTEPTSSEKVRLRKGLRQRFLKEGQPVLSPQGGGGSRWGRKLAKRKKRKALQG